MYVRSSLLGFVMGKDTHNPTCSLMICHIGFQFNHRILLFYVNVLIIQWQDETLYDPWAYLSQLLPSYHTCFNLSRPFFNFVVSSPIMLSIIQQMPLTNIRWSAQLRLSRQSLLRCLVVALQPLFHCFPVNRRIIFHFPVEHITNMVIVFFSIFNTPFL